jgi:hypothetical protein
MLLAGKPNMIKAVHWQSQSVADVLNNFGNAPFKHSLATHISLL